MAAPIKTKVTPEVTQELTTPIGESRPIVGIAPRPLFATTTEDVPQVEMSPARRQLTPRTIAEHAAGKAAISQYTQPE